ncbi:uncharacterized protein LOC110689869 [Chenopodium quinoa]|uniref:uncharacterized protein LOC110689869 n=1 Tax=Chenopodium quinoa TaxID=63459 RepID=UPI000B792A94|nr:uncharacterized protein LOC110689869 [Chenopodium quinoa]
MGLLELLVKVSANAAGGGAIRRGNGSWYIGFSAKYNAVNPLATELYAIIDGLAIAQDLGVKKIEVETDAESLRTMLLTIGGNPHHELAAVICDAASLFSDFEVAFINHIPREMNIMVHKLAEYGKDMAVGYKTHYLVPECVKNFYEADLEAAAA